MMPSKVGDAADVVTIPIESVAKAGLVWETKTGIITNVSWDSATGCVRFETGSVLGNALLAVYDKSNKILWSWHIWRTDGVDLTGLNQSHVVKFKTNTTYSWYSGATGAYPGYGRERDLVMMECKIGAHLDKNSSATTYADNLNEYNIVYQFGRKDPMPMSAVYNGSFGTIGVSETPTKFPEILDYVVAYPNQFIKGVKDTGCNWMNGATLNSEAWCVSNCLWGDNSPYGVSTVNATKNLDPVPWNVDTSKDVEKNGNKTIYDPSPAGWRVAPADTWSAITDGSVQKWTEVKAYKSDFSNGFTFHFGNSSGISAFCPAAGRRNETTGAIETVGELDHEWFSSPCGQFNLQAQALVFNAWTIHVAQESYRGYGFSVRCVKE
jgi:hypothetical protein